MKDVSILEVVKVLRDVYHTTIIVKVFWNVNDQGFSFLAFNEKIFDVLMEDSYPMPLHFRIGFRDFNLKIIIIDLGFHSFHLVENVPEPTYFFCREYD